MGIYVLLLVISHLISDYPLQTKEMIKNKKTFKGIWPHIFVHIKVTLSVTLLYIIIEKKNYYEWEIYIYCLLIIILLHYVIDYIKEKLVLLVNSKLETYKASMVKAFLYVLDQLLHVGTIIVAVQLTFRENYYVFKKIYNLIDMNQISQLNTSTQIFLTVIIILLNIYFVGYLVGIILAPFKPANLVTETIMEVPFKSEVNGPISYKDFANLNMDDMLDEKVTELNIITAQKKIILIKDSPVNSGMLIGSLERNIILILYLVNSIPAIGFLIAMKALTRFKQFEDKSFAEYYLIGSMASILFAMIFGYILQRIW